VGYAEIQVPILFEDNHILVVVKPVNMPTQEDESGDLDLVNWLKRDLKERYNKPGNVFVGLVHRLDRPVGGVMVFAKTSKAASRLSDQVRTRKLRKVYRAVVHGTPDPKVKSRLTHYLLKDAKTNTVRAVDASVSGAKEAILDYRVVDTGRGGLSLVEVDLFTGRPHQIRVQMSTLGHPLYGDQKYGPHVNKPGQQIALWAVRLEFEHPTLRELISLESSPPDGHPWSLWDSL
jgi:23S rRNA pseudouridine1911/1915/1917 synthase